MRAAPPLQEVDLTGAKTNKGRFWWELRKRRALSQQEGLIEMQIRGRGPARRLPPLNFSPPRRAAWMGPLTRARRPGPALAGALVPASLCGRRHVGKAPPLRRHHLHSASHTWEVNVALERRFSRLRAK